MRAIQLKPFYYCFLLFFLSLTAFAQESNSTEYKIELNSGVSSEENLPFWMIANKFDEIPSENYGLIKASIFSDFKNPQNKFDFSYKAALSGTVSNESNVFINELYAAIRYNSFILEIGPKNDEILFEGLSISNGNIIKSTNTRAMPGINFKTNGFVKLPFAQNWLTTKFSYSEYLLNDKRVVDNARVHHKSLSFKFKLSNSFNLTYGLNHYVQWGGTSEEYGKLPTTFKDYLKIVTGSSGGKSSNINDQINAIGNHVGSYLLKLDHVGETVDWSAYWSHPFEDRSGRELMNYPDALYGVFIDFKNNKSLITHLASEITYTKHMSGKGAISGNDNYFNNYVYESGWTYFGKTIGSPLLLPNAPIDGITHGIAQNRVLSYHVAFKGYLNNSIAYKTNLTYSNYPLAINKDQFSTSFECIVPQTKLPFEIGLGAAADFGNFSPSTVGGFLKLSKTGLF